MFRLLAILFIVVITSNCTTQTADYELIQSIPDDSKIVIALDDLEDLNDLLQGNPLFNQMSSLSRVEELKKSSSFLNQYSLSTQSFITLSMEGKNKAVVTLLTKNNAAKNDSVNIINRNIYNEIEIVERRSQGGSYYTAVKDGTHMASSSQLVIESLIRRELQDYVFDDTFASLFERTHKDLSLYFKASDEQWLHQFILGKNKTNANNHASWYQIEPSMDATSLYLEGLVVYKDSLNQKQAVYDQLDAQENKAALITPAAFLSLKSVTYDNLDVLKSNLNKYKGSYPKLPRLLDQIMRNAKEISTLNLTTGKGIVFSIQPYEDLFINLDSLSQEKVTYRDEFIYSLQESQPTKSLQPIVPEINLKHLAVVDNFMVMTENMENMERILSNYQNGTTLAAQSWWIQASENMSTSSTVLQVSSVDQLSSPYFEIDKADLNLLSKLDKTVVKAIISQYVHEDGYAFYRMEVPYATTAADQPLVAQIGTYKAEIPVIAGPFLFPNHLNNTYDIAVQTEDFELTLLSETGKVHWRRKLDSKILGTIYDVDVYKNGRKQLLFTTSQKVHLLDRNGNTVDKYPYSSNSMITQPLGVFDYDNNRDYRIVVTTGGNLTMLDARGNLVNGFAYKAQGEITSAPQHYRKGTKDYIGFTTSNGRFMLLNRTGQIRTKVGEKIVSKSPIYFQNDLIKLIMTSNTLVHINPTTGKVTQTKAAVSDQSQLAISDRTQVLQTDQELVLNSEKVQLPYGSYTPPSITRIKNEDYITLIDDGDNKVYVLNSKGEVLPFFPVYGNTTAVIGGNKNRTLVTLDNNEVLIYRW